MCVYIYMYTYILIQTRRVSDETKIPIIHNTIHNTIQSGCRGKCVKDESCGCNSKYAPIIQITHKTFKSCTKYSNYAPMHQTFNYTQNIQAAEANV